MKNFLLKIPCPSCLLYNRIQRAEIWVHAKCGGKLYVDENAIVHCPTCNKKAHFSQMKITCNDRAHVYEYVSLDNIAAAVACAKIGITNKSIKWYRNFVEHL